jgi:hypothetical protein
MKPPGGALRAGGVKWKIRAAWAFSQKQKGVSAKSQSENKYLSIAFIPVPLFEVPVLPPIMATSS